MIQPNTSRGISAFNSPGSLVLARASFASLVRVISVGHFNAELRWFVGPCPQHFHSEFRWLADPSSGFVAVQRHTSLVRQSVPRFHVISTLGSLDRLYVLTFRGTSMLRSAGSLVCACGISVWNFVGSLVLAGASHHLDIENRSSLSWFFVARRHCNSLFNTHRCLVHTLPEHGLGLAAPITALGRGRLGRQSRQRVLLWREPGVRSPWLEHFHWTWKLRRVARNNDQHRQSKSDVLSSWMDAWKQKTGWNCYGIGRADE